jgi:ParB family chromosome partitioning protein
MAKLDQLMKAGGANIAESMGAGGGPAARPGPSSMAPARWQGVAKSKNAVEIPLDKITADPGQPREEFEEDALERLAESLKKRGQLQPIRVRWDEGAQKYAIICGERRFRAATRAGLATLSCVVADEPVDAGELLSLQLIENCLREDLKPIEQARAFRALMDRNGWSGHQAAKELGVPQSAVVRALALLELPESVREEVEQGGLSPATAYEVSKLADPAEQEELAGKAVAEKLTRAAVIDEVIRRKGKAPRARKPGKGGVDVIALPSGGHTATFEVPGGRVTVELEKTDPKGMDLFMAMSKAISVAMKQIKMAS